MSVREPFLARAKLGAYPDVNFEGWSFGSYGQFGLAARTSAIRRRSAANADFDENLEARAKITTAPVDLIETSRLVGALRFELRSRTNLVLTDYKSAALPLSYTPAAITQSGDQAGIRKGLIGLSTVMTKLYNDRRAQGNRQRRKLSNPRAFGNFKRMVPPA